MLTAIIVAAALFGAPASRPDGASEAQFFTEPEIGKPLYEPYRRGIRPGLVRGSPRLDRRHDASSDMRRTQGIYRSHRTRR